MMSKYQSLVKWRWIEIYGLIFGVVLLLIVMGIVWSKASELIELNGQVAKLEHLEGLKNLKITKEGENWYLLAPTKRARFTRAKGRPRPEIELKAEHENRITTAIRATYERIKAGFEQLRGIVQNVSRTINRPAEHKQSLERAERAVDDYERAVSRTFKSRAGAERAIELYSREINRPAEPKLSPSQEQFKRNLRYRKLKRRIKPRKRLNEMMTLA